MILAFLVLPTFWTSNLLTAETINLLQTADLFITVGNDLRADDGVGPYIYNQCRNKNNECQIINAGDKPEGIIDQAIALNPKKIVIIDAADFGGVPGEARIIKHELIPDTTLSTHTFPLRVIAKIIEDDTKAPVSFLGIQPKSVGFEEELSEEVKKVADQIIEMLNQKA